MKRLCFILPLLIATNCFSQNAQKLSTFLSSQVTKTLCDRTITNNNSGFGLGLHATWNTGTWVKPIVELNADFFTGTKELYTTLAGKLIEAKSGVLGIYFGPLFQPAERFFIATTVGTSIYNGKA